MLRRGLMGSEIIKICRTNAAQFSFGGDKRGRLPRSTLPHSRHLGKLTLPQLDKRVIANALTEPDACRVTGLSEVTKPSLSG